ncbi:MFS transporter [Streptomyces sp. NPDC002928]|uniref:MFS transporter n=1 Tax=Streptomyces sp. NPDC002928 TaxID=3154440 RepID=UPI0033A66A64
MATVPGLTPSSSASRRTGGSAAPGPNTPSATPCSTDAATVARIGTLAAVAGAIGIAGARIGGRLADRFPLARVLIAVQLLRALAPSALLVTDPYALLLVSASLGGLGDRAASVLTKLYATRVAGPDRVRYQAVHRTLAAAAALALGSTAAYQWLLAGDALSFVAAALLTVRCGEPPSTEEPSPHQRTRLPQPSRRTPGATARTSPTSPPRPSSSATTPSSKSACPFGSRTRAMYRKASHPCCSSSTT